MFHVHHLLLKGHSASQLALFSVIEELETAKNVFVFFVILVDLKHSFGCVKGKFIAVLAFGYFFTFLVLQIGEVSIGDVLNIEPFDVKMTLKLSVLVFPPKGECLLVIA